jgi:hypothetical protein
VKENTRITGGMTGMTEAVVGFGDTVRTHDARRPRSNERVARGGA